MSDRSGLPYHLLQRGGLPGVWRPLVGVLALAASFVVVAPVIVSVLFGAGLSLTGHDSDAVTRLLDLDDLTPTGLAYLNVVLACQILAAWLVVRAVHGLRPRWLASVAGRIRWRWLAVCVGLAMVALLATLIVSALVPSSDDGAEVSGHLNSFTSTTRDFLLVILFLTPLQAAGEEYAFRGYLTQVFGAAFGRVAAVVVPAVLFALAHGGQSAPVFFDRFAFGVVAGLAVVLTGGLEAGIAMHVLNNWLAFGLALAYGDMSTSLHPTGGSWWTILVTATQSLVYLGLVLWAARRRGVRTTTERPVGPGELVGPDPLV